MITINSYNPEFGYELISVIPYAGYWHKEGEKIKVISAHDMQPFYFFVDEFEVSTVQRSWKNVKKITTPNKDIHKLELDKKEFFVPDYRQRFKGLYDFDVVICNRYNNEWPGLNLLNKPLNFFSLDILNKIFKLLSDFKIAYLNIDTAGIEYYDDAKPLSIRDYDICSKYSNVTHIKDITSKSSDSFNTVQLRVMAGARMYITMNGGYSIMASFFGGTNIIYTNPTWVNNKVYPRENQTGDFNYYKDFNNSYILNPNNYAQLLDNIKQYKPI